MFIYPMWDNESQRIGKQKCTPWGYTLHVIAELLGFMGLLLVLGVGIYLGYRALSHSFHASLLWLLAVPFGLGLISQAMYQFSWVLASRRGFDYDYDKAEASWIENGEQMKYKWKREDSS